MLSILLAFYLGGFVAATVIERYDGEPVQRWRDAARAGVAWPVLAALAVILDIVDIAERRGRR